MKKAHTQQERTRLATPSVVLPAFVPSEAREKRFRVTFHASVTSKTSV